jgi:hypothetical protein
MSHSDTEQQPVPRIQSSETYEQKWARLQEENPGAFSAKFIIPARILVVVVIIILIKMCESSLPLIGPDECLVDYMHIHSQSINNSLTSSGSTAILTIQAFYTLSVDLSVVLFLLFWVAKGKSMRIIIAFVLFYLFKILCDASIELTAPPHMIWMPTVVPSLLIPSAANYNFTCAFCPGVYMMLFLECLQHKPLVKYAWAFMLWNLITIFYAIVAQLNWTSDIISGLVCGGFAFVCAEYASKQWIDTRVGREYNWGEIDDEKQRHDE